MTLESLQVSHRAARPSGSSIYLGGYPDTSLDIPATMANHTISWKPDPDYRGTFDIFSSCLGTLLICIWSAIHVDVVKGKSWYERVGEKMGWVLVGLLIPELTLFIAFTQLQRARKLKKEVYALLWKDLPPAESWYYTLVRKIYGPQSHEKFTKASRVSTMFASRGLPYWF